jgi:endonuclease YncB( thermonuclease family)
MSPLKREPPPRDNNDCRPPQGPSRWARLPLLLGMLMLIVSPALLAGVLEGRVVAITDGDTVKVLDERRTQHVIRLAGIDAPEQRMPFGQRSKQNLSDLVYGKYVVVEGKKNDRYGRLVGKVLVSGHDANLAQIQAGMAWHYKEYQSEQSVRDRQIYSDAEEDAKSNRLGLWDDVDPVAPWAWRAARRSDH